MQTKQRVFKVGDRVKLSDVKNARQWTIQSVGIDSLNISHGSNSSGTYEYRTISFSSVVKHFPRKSKPSKRRFTPPLYDLTKERKMSQTNSIVRAAQIVLGAKAILISAGAGMGVDSGLPDFRGTQGFWKAYPPLQKLGIDFMSAANPELFVSNPRLAWAFYGHRKNLYAGITPHAGFSILKQWADRAQNGHFVYTSNVDGAFQKAGFKNIVECHGSIHHIQCSELCAGIFDFDDSIDVDMDSFNARGALPKCESCGAVGRPNILMFGDGYWQNERTSGQRMNLAQWMSSLSRNDNVALIELGAGTDIPSIRSFNARFQSAYPNARLVRINPRECDVLDERDVGIPLGALDALKRIDDIV